MASTWNVWSLSPDRRHWLAIAEEIPKREATEHAARMTASAQKHQFKNAAYLALPSSQRPGPEHVPAELGSDE